MKYRRILKKKIEQKANFNPILTCIFRSKKMLQQGYIVYQHNSWLLKSRQLAEFKEMVMLFSFWQDID